MALASRANVLAPSLLSRLAGSTALADGLSGTSAAVELRSVRSQHAASEGSSEEITVEVNPYQVHRLDGPPTTVKTNKEELLHFFTTMYKMRRMEIAADMMYKAKFIRGFCHLYDGQEAVHMGIEAAANFKDSVITSYRDHCTHLGRGGTVLEVMAELMGKTDGASKGVGGSMHMYKKEHNFYGGCGIVGAQVPVGAGLGLAHKYRKDGSVAFALYGDGAANQGQVFEAYNMAALWELPVIFVCENNHYGMGTADMKAAKSAKYYTRGDYMPGIKVDGMDVLAVKNAVAYIKDYVLKNGPVVMEADTYRYHGHSMSDPGSTYRTRDEITSMRQQRDPIEYVRKLLTDHNLMESAELKKIEKSIKKEIDEAVEKAKASKQPPAEMLWTNTYKDTLGVSTRGIDSHTKIKLL